LYSSSHLGKMRVRVRYPKPQQDKTLADRCAEVIGSWFFIGGQAVALSLWIILNGVTLIRADPYPFILLNLLLSTQAAFTGPILLMAANRQSEVDRKRDVDHYMIDIHGSQVIDEMASQIEQLYKYSEKGDGDEEHF